ncbi:MAG: BglG family transcription antiterminator [Sporolactobacillus sp.]
MELDEKALMQQLLLQHEPPIADVTEKLAASRAQIVQLVHEINEHLPSTSITVAGDQLHVSDQCADELYGLLTGDPAAASFNDADFRRRLIVLELLTKHEAASLQSLSDQFYVSRNTMYADIKQIKSELQTQQLTLNYSRKTGYCISGSEYALRNYLVQLTRSLLRSRYGMSCLGTLSIIHSEDLDVLSACLSQIEQLAQIRLTDEQMEELPYIIAVMLTRIRCYPQPWSFKIEKYDIRNTVEFPIIKDSLRSFTFLKDVDILYLSLHILSCNRIESALDFLNGEEILNAIDEFIRTLKNRLAVQFVKETEFKEKLLLHVQPAIFRNLFGFRIHNPLANRFIKEHGDIYQTVADAVSPFEQIVGHPFSKEETVYLSMIVLGWLYQSNESHSSCFKAVVLCPNGTSISKLLLENLKMMFPDIEFLGAYSFRQFERQAMELDFIFTTKPINSNVQEIIVPPFLEPESRRQLRETVRKLLRNDASFRAKRAVQAIKDLLPIDKRGAAEVLLKLFFEENNNNTVQAAENRPTPLRITSNNILIVEEPVAWSDCLDVVFAPMLARKTADLSYLARCKRVFYKHYRQMLIGPNIYLPHTTADSGLTDLEMVIFRQGVTDADGNCIFIMVGLVPSAANEHVPLLLSLNDLLIRPDVREALLTVQTPEEALAICERSEAFSS